MTQRPPVIILVRPQLAENIGMCARAMANFGLEELRLVAPREGWPKKGAHQAASGAAHILTAARLYETTAEAIADLHVVYATTARERGQMKPVFSGEEAAAALLRDARGGLASGILFGPERTGLENDDVALASALISYPVNPAFPSLNLAQAVLILGYERWKRVTGGAAPIAPTRLSPPATREHVLSLMQHLEAELDAVGFFHPPDKRPIMARNLRNILHRLEMSRQDVQTLRGVIGALVGGRRGAKPPRPD